MAYSARFYSACVQADRNRWRFFLTRRVQTKLLVNQPGVKLGQRSPLNTPKPVCPAWFHTLAQWPVNFTFKPLKEISWRRQGLKTHVSCYSGKKKKTTIHITFSMNSKQLNVCPSVLMSSSNYLKLIYFTAAFLFFIFFLFFVFLQAPRFISCGPSVSTEWRQQM